MCFFKFNQGDCRVKKTMSLLLGIIFSSNASESRVAVNPIAQVLFLSNRGVRGFFLLEQGEEWNYVKAKLEKSFQYRRGTIRLLEPSGKDLLGVEGRVSNDDLYYIRGLMADLLAKKELPCLSGEDL